VLAPFYSEPNEGTKGFVLYRQSLRPVATYRPPAHRVPVRD
jgi:hypothetical protein